MTNRQCGTCAGRIGPGKYFSMVAPLDTGREDISLGIRSYTLASRPLLCILLPTWHQTQPNPLTHLCEEVANLQRRTPARSVVSGKGPAPPRSITFTTSFKFNQQVEFDLLFYRTFIVCHLICRATRWHAGCAIPNKEGEAIYESICTSWVSIHGPMQQLIADGESGLWSEAVSQSPEATGH